MEAARAYSKNCTVCLEQDKELWGETNLFVCNSILGLGVPRRARKLGAL